MTINHSSSETHRVEFKRELTPSLDLEKEVIAFLNSAKGGFIYIGVDQHAKALSNQAIDSDMLKIKDRIKMNIAPSAMGLFDVIVDNWQGTEVIKLIIASGSEKPYFKQKYGMTEKGCFIRLGSATEPMKQNQIDRLFAGRTRNSIGKIKSHRQELSFAQLRIYYEEKRKPLNQQFKKNLELLTEEGELNYAGYLLADENAVSIKVAKYADTTRVHLIESNEYGYSSLIKATLSVLHKLETENTTSTLITAKNRIESRLWEPVALREAVINAMIHNDYTREVPPKFEIFSDRLEITSAGSLPEGLSQEEFFEGYSIPRNKELMRVFKDLELVEQLGTGVQRILAHYERENFVFTDNFTRIKLPIKAAHQDFLSDIRKTSIYRTSDQATDQVSDQVKRLLLVLNHNELSTQELLNLLQLRHLPSFRKNYLHPALDSSLLEMTQPESPRSPTQKYRLTEKGFKLLERLSTTLALNHSQ